MATNPFEAAGFSPAQPSAPPPASRLNFVPFPKTPTPQTQDQAANTRASTNKTNLEAANIVKPHVLSASEVAANPTLDPQKAWAMSADGNVKPIGDVPQPFKVGDADAINHGFDLLDTIGAAKELSKNPLATGTRSASVANIPGSGLTGVTQDRADLQTKLQSVAGDLRQIGIQNLYQSTGKKGVGTIARSTSEQQALQSSLAPIGYVTDNQGHVQPSGAQPSPMVLQQGLKVAQNIYERHLARLFNMDPDNPESISIVRAAVSNPQNRPALVQAFRQNGGAMPSLRFVTGADGKDIPPILVPSGASDEDVRNAVRSAGYNVAPNVSIDNSRQTMGQPAAQQSSGNGAAHDWGGGLGSLYHGFAHTLTAGLVDPYEAAMATAGNNIGTALGLNKSTASEGQIFDQSLADVKARNQKDWNDHPVAGWTGSLASLPLMAAGVGTAAARGAIDEGAGTASKLASWLFPKGASMGTRAVRSLPLTVPVGAAEGAANAGEGNRTSGAVKGGAVSGALGMALTPVIDVAGNIAGWALNRLPDNPITGSGTWRQFAGLAPEADPAAMRGAAAEQRTVGTAPAVIDTLNGSSLDHVRGSVGQREGSTAATTLNAEADARAAAAPQNMAGQARAAINGARQTAVELPGQAPGTAPAAMPGKPLELRENLADRRDAQFAATLDPIRSQAVDLPHDTTALLSGGDMGAVIRAARGYTTDMHERESLNALASWAEQANKSGLATSPPPIEIGAADALRQALNAAGSIKQADASHVAMRTAAADLTSGLERMVPRYAEAMGAYRTQSRIASPTAQQKGRPEAISLGQDMLSGDPEQMAMDARHLPPLDEPVGFGTPGANGVVNVSPRQAAMEGAIRAVEQKASASGPQALGKQMQTAEQQARNRVVLTPDQATRMERGIGVEADRVAAANRAAPSSAPAAEPGVDRSTIGDAAGAAAFHSPYHTVRGIAGLMQRAQISPQQANNIAKGIVDPKQTYSIIGQIQRAGYTKQRAQALYGMLRLQLSAAASRGATAQ